MNEKTKIIGACVLILGGVGVWAPQLPQLLGGSKSPSRTPLPAEGEEPLDMPGVDSAFVEDVGAVDLAGSGGAAQESESDDALSRIEALLLDDQEGKDDGLESLAMSWQQSAKQDEQASDGEPSKLPSEPKEEAEEDPGRENPQPIPFNANLGGFGSTFTESNEAEVQDPFDTFLAEYPLSGLILGKKRQLASFGPYTLEVGDFIPGTNARLERIERRSVVVSRDKKEFSISLPPFRSNPVQTEDQMPGDLPGEAMDSSTGSAAPAPTTSSPIQPAALTEDDQS